MPSLHYHQATYDLLTKKPIDTEKAIRERLEYDASFCTPAGEDEAAHCAKQAQWREIILAWTKLDLYQRPVQFSPDNIAKLDALEAKYQVKLPAAVREWYSLDIAPQIMSTRSWGCFDIAEFCPFSALDYDYVPRSETIWYFLDDEYIDQGGESIGFHINAGDDPPVVAAYNHEFIQLAPTFSEFIFSHFLNWYAHYTYEFQFALTYHPGIQSMQTSPAFHLPFQHLSQHYKSVIGTYDACFYDDHSYILVHRQRILDGAKTTEWRDILAGGSFFADRFEALLLLILRLWGENPPVFFMHSWMNEEIQSYIKDMQRNQVRRVLRDAADWITATNLATALGASNARLMPLMRKQVEQLIQQGEAEEHPENQPDKPAEHRFRIRQA